MGEPLLERPFQYVEGCNLPVKTFTDSVLTHWVLSG